MFHSFTETLIIQLRKISLYRLVNIALNGNGLADIPTTSSVVGRASPGTTLSLYFLNKLTAKKKEDTFDNCSPGQILLPIPNGASVFLRAFSSPVLMSKKRSGRNVHGSLPNISFVKAVLGLARIAVPLNNTERAEL
jgi:hypothetical protein